MTYMCVDAVTRAAADLGYECAVAHDACAAFMFCKSGKSSITTQGKVFGILW